MKAMILAAGLGSRMGSLTATTPKALITAGGKPLIYYVVQQLKTVGVKEVIINLHFLGQKIIDYFNANSNFGLKIHYSHEAELLDTGGGLAKVKEFFSDQEDIIVHNADIYSKIPLSEMLTFHQIQQAITTLATREKAAGRVLLFSAAGLHGWRNTKTSQEELLNATVNYWPRGFCGIQIINTRLFKYFPSDNSRFSIIKLYLTAAASAEKVISYDIQKHIYFDVGTPENLALLEKRFKELGYD